jgi:hypothetical protein
MRTENLEDIRIIHAEFRDPIPKGDAKLRPPQAKDSVFIT